MTAGYEVIVMTEEERARLERVYDDLMALTASRVPSVQGAATHALAHIAQALNGEGLRYELYTDRLPSR